MAIVTFGNRHAFLYVSWTTVGFKLVSRNTSIRFGDVCLRPSTHSYARKSIDMQRIALRNMRQLVQKAGIQLNTAEDNVTMRISTRSVRSAIKLAQQLKILKKTMSDPSSILIEVDKFHHSLINASGPSGKAKQWTLQQLIRQFSQPRPKITRPR